MSQELETVPDNVRRSPLLRHLGPQPRLRAPTVHQFARRAFAGAQELARAIDGYKLRHRRRFITYEEMLSVIKSLGYQRLYDETYSGRPTSLPGTRMPQQQ